MPRSRLNSLIGACTLLLLGAHCGAAPIAWRTQWSDAVFVQAEKDRRFVILDLHAVWCHWCHVMDEKTYGDPKVQSLISKHYVAVSVDAE